jgi:hypothetical protein
VHSIVDVAGSMPALVDAGGSWGTVLKNACAMGNEIHASTAYNLVLPCSKRLWHAHCERVRVCVGGRRRRGGGL